MPVLGALAPDLAQLIPARLDTPAPSRALPGRRKPKWQDEVRNRVRERRRARLGGDLPLFADSATAVLEVEDVEELIEDIAPAAPTPELLLRRESGEDEDPAPSGEDGPRLVWSVPAPAAPAPPKERVAERWSLGDDAVVAPPAERPRSASTSWITDAPGRDSDARARDDRPPYASLLLTEPEEEPLVDELPLEYPASWTDRLQAAVFDLGVLVTLWGVVVYFASRAAHVSPMSLRPAGPPLALYLAFLGVLYAVYFTGTSGRTIGKIVCGLKVVDVAGRAPGYPKALARVLLGTIGIGVAMLGLVPIFFDPARRALHDRIVRTRVVKY